MVTLGSPFFKIIIVAIIIVTILTHSIPCLSDLPSRSGGVGGGSNRLVVQATWPRPLLPT